MCFYLRNWQVTFLLYTLGVFISEYTAKAFTEPRDYRVVFLIQKRAPTLKVKRPRQSAVRHKAGPLALLNFVVNKTASFFLYSFRQFSTWKRN